MDHTDNRANLLACALERFAARGYDAVGVQEIVDAAAVTKPTLYHYFGSKQGLLEALLAEHFAPLLAAVAQAAAYRGDLPATIERLIATCFRFAQQDGTFYRLQLALYVAPPDSEAHRAVAGYDAELQRILEELFRRAAQDHGNMRGRHRRYAATLLGTINTYIGLALNGYMNLDGPLVHTVAHEFQHGIYS